MTAARHAMSNRVNALLTANQALTGKTANIQTRRQQLATGRCAFAIAFTRVRSHLLLHSAHICGSLAHHLIGGLRYWWPRFAISSRSRFKASSTP